MTGVYNIPPCSKGPEHDWQNRDQGRHCGACGLVWSEPQQPGRRRRLIRIPRTPAFLGTPSSLGTPSIVDRLRERDGNQCVYCGRPFSSEVPPTRDHRITQRELREMQSGGVPLPGTFENLQLACLPCNGLRGDMDELAFREGIANGTIPLPWRDWEPST